MQVTIGIDIGGTNTDFGLVDREGRCLANGKLETRSFETPDRLAATLAHRVSELDDGASVLAAGVGAPNGNYYKGTIERAPNLHWQRVVPMRDLLADSLGVPVFLTNDANAAAIGEMHFGAAKGYDDFLVVTLGTGVGSGFVSGGRLVYGHDGFAGELGHSIIEEDGRPCGCGRRGCLETYASATGFVQTARQMASASEDSPLRNIPGDQLTARHISAAARKGDAIALAIFDYTAKKLAFGLANAVAITSPKRIVLFGGLANAGELILAPTRRYLDGYLLNVFQGSVELVTTGLSEQNAAVLGAAALAWEELDRP